MKPNWWIWLLVLIFWAVVIGVARADVVDDLIPLIISAESPGNPYASDGKSFGLMGISPIVLRQYNDDMYKNYITCYEDGFLAQPIAYTKFDLYKPDINKQVGRWYLNWIRENLPDKYKTSKPHIISAYNNGIGWLRKHNWNPPRSHENKIYNKIYNGKL